MDYCGQVISRSLEMESVVERISLMAIHLTYEYRQNPTWHPQMIEFERKKGMNKGSN